MHIDENKKFDKRTIERNLSEGIISAEEWKKYLKTLPDVSANTDSVKFYEGKGEKTTEEKETKSEKSADKEEATTENE